MLTLITSARVRLAGALLLTGALAAACTSPDGTKPDDGDNVSVVESSADAIGYKDLRSFVAQAPTVVVARVTKAEDVVAEVKPSPGTEGAADGEGPDLYGAITFEVETVLRGDPVRELKVAYVSGKRTGSHDRIAYRYDYLTAVQSDDARLRPVAALKDTRFVVLVAPNTVYPLDPAYSILAHPYGLGSIQPDGTVKLGPDGLPPVSVEGTPAKPATLDDIKAAIA